MGLLGRIILHLISVEKRVFSLFFVGGSCWGIRTLQILKYDFVRLIDKYDFVRLILQSNYAEFDFEYNLVKFEFLVELCRF